MREWCARHVPSGAWPTKHRLLTTNYEPKSPSRRASDQSDEKIVIVRGALNNAEPHGGCLIGANKTSRKTHKSVL